MSIPVTLPAVSVFNPVSGAGTARNLSLAETQGWGIEIERLVSAFVSSSGQVFYATKAELDADLAHAAATLGLVLSGADAGFYKKAGASGTGSWSYIGPLANIKGDPGLTYLAHDVASAANALVLTTPSTITETAYATVYTTQVLAANTGAVTVSVNGGTAKPLVDNTGAALVANYFSPTMAILFTDTGPNYKLYSPGDIEAAVQVLLTQAQTAKTDAEAFAGLAASFAIDAAFPPSLAAHKLLDETANTVAIRLDDGRTYVWNGGADISADLVLKTCVATGVSGSLINASAHGFETGVPVIVTPATANFAANTVFYTIRFDANNLRLATTLENAAAGTYISTSTNATDLTIRQIADPLQADYVIPTGKNLDGSQGAYIPNRDVPANEGEIGGITYLRLSSRFRDGHPMLPSDFGVTENVTAGAIIRNTMGLQDALQQPYELRVPDNKTYRTGPLALSNAGCRSISGAGTLLTAEADQKLLTGTDVDNLKIVDVKLDNGGSLGDAGDSAAGLLSLTTCDNFEIGRIGVKNSRFVGIELQGCNGGSVYGIDFATCLQAIAFRGVKKVQFTDSVVDGKISVPELFQAQVSFAANSGHPYGSNEGMLVNNVHIYGGGDAQGFLGHDLSESIISSCHVEGCVMPYSFNASSAADKLNYLQIIGNYADCLTTIAQEDVEAVVGIQIGADAANPALGGLIMGNIIRNFNAVMQAEDGVGAIRAQRTVDLMVAVNTILDAYNSGILANFENYGMGVVGNTVRNMLGTGARSFWAKNANNEVTLSANIFDGAVNAIENDVAGNQIIVQENTYRSISGLQLVGCRHGYSKTITAAGTLDLSGGVTELVFNCGSAASFSTVTGAIPGHEYVFRFQNGNATLARGGGAGFMLNAAANITGSAGGVVKLIARSATQLEQASAVMVNS